MSAKTWSELGRKSRLLIVAGGVAEFSLLAAALIDIRRRPADQIRGSERLWTAFAFVSFVGPLSYFTFGRRQSAVAER